MKILLCIVLWATAFLGSEGLAQPSATSQAAPARDTKPASRLELARTLLRQTGFEQEFAKIFVQGMQGSVNSLKAITEQGDSARRKFSQFLGEESTNLLPEALTMIAQAFVDHFTIGELQEMLTWKNLNEGTGPTKTKFDAKDAALRSSFELAGAVIGEKVWKRATERLTVEERGALLKGLSSK